MRNLAALLVLLTAMIGCEGGKATSTAPPGGPRTSNATNVQGQAASDKFEQVFDIISSSKVLSMHLKEMLKQTKGSCMLLSDAQKESKRGNVACNEQTGIKYFFATPEEGGAIFHLSVAFDGAKRCTLMRDTLTKKFGAPTDSVDQCNASWALKPSADGAGRIASISSEEPGSVYFSISEEQGP